MLLGVFLSANLYAETNSIVLGKTYPIIEQDLIEYLKSKAAAMQQSGEWQAMQEESVQDIKDNLNNLPALPGITRTQEEKSWYYDPSIKVPYDITALNGKIIAKKGQKVNPLDYVTMNETLIFFDGRDPDQVQFAEKQKTKYEGRVKLILIGGPLTTINKKFDMPIYYDQDSKLTTKFGITQVPAIVSQKDKLLLVQEVQP